jgi:hypothetical protein
MHNSKNYIITLFLQGSRPLPGIHELCFEENQNCILDVRENCRVGNVPLLASGSGCGAVWPVSNRDVSTAVRTSDCERGVVRCDPNEIVPRDAAVDGYVVLHVGGGGNEL